MNLKRLIAMLSKHSSLRITVSFVLWLSVAQLSAQELSAGMGILSAPGPAATTYAWQLGFRTPWRNKYALSFNWNNEGHLPEHHRDGGSLQGWYRPVRMEPNLSVAVGLGIYRYNDTMPTQQASYRNQHGLGAVLSIQLIANPPSTPWNIFLQSNSIRIPGETETISIQAGIAYHLSTTTSLTDRRRKSEETSPPNAWSFYFGQTVLNSLKSETANAWSLEYRRTLKKHVAATLSYSDEGDTKLLDRKSVGAHVWLGGTYLGGLFQLELGAGPTLARVYACGAPGRERDRFWRLSMRASMGAGWRMSSEWMLRTVWHRTFSNYDRDTDQFVTGLAYLW